MEQDFIQRITRIFEEHLSSEQFGVSELAREAGMSRSNLLRKIKKLTGLSASQFIRKVRLEHAMAFLREQQWTVSEVGYKTGFNSTSYFIKCFHDHYGYPPGEVGKKQESKPDQTGHRKKRRIPYSVLTVAMAAILLGLILMILKPFQSRDRQLEKSIAVLPFKNESNDSAYVYLINGLMESVLGDLQKIRDLRVISRTSVEKFRHHSATAPEIARELDANYLVTGSGQKAGDQILLHIQLLEAPGDRQLWSGRYLREYEDIFQLQLEIAKDITREIEAIITPEERASLEKVPTSNVKAYDYFLRGLEQFRKGTTQDLLEAITLFKEAIIHDPEFARAHADIAIAYAFMDFYKTEKQHSEDIAFYADRALSLDPRSAQSLVAKALYHMSIGEHEASLPYLEQALEFNPNSSMVINALSDYYTRRMPDTEKYLEYALKGLRLDLAAHDSAEASILLLHVGNAFIQSGFVEEAGEYITRSLDYDPDNLYAEILRAYILYARGQDLVASREILLHALEQDSSRFDIRKEIGNLSYYLRDFPAAYRYYQEYFDSLRSFGFQLPRGEYAKFGLILRETGRPEASERHFREYLDYARNDQSKYKHLSLSVYHAYRDQPDSSLNEMRMFAEQENYPYWYVLFLDTDPLLEDMYDIPEFQLVLEQIRVRFWQRHHEIKTSLQSKGVI